MAKKTKIKRKQTLRRPPRYHTLEGLLQASMAQLPDTFKYRQLARLLDRGVADNPHLVGHLIGYYLDKRMRWNKPSTPKPVNPVAATPPRLVH